MAARLPYPALVASIAAMLRLDQVVAPKRLHLALPGGMLLVMPATDAALGVTKLVTVHPGNAALGLPTIQGDAAVLDARTGERLGILDGPVLTARRTAALSLLAARPGAGPARTAPAGRAGVQAREHLETSRPLAWSPWSSSPARPPAPRVWPSRPGPARLRQGRGGLGPGGLPPGRHGHHQRPARAAGRPGPAAAGPLHRRRGRLHAGHGRDPAPADARVPRPLRHPEGALAEAGDVIQAGLDATDLTPLAAVLDLAAPPPGPTVFKSVGHALFDLAAAKTAFGR